WGGPAIVGHLYGNSGSLRAKPPVAHSLSPPYLPASNTVSLFLSTDPLKMTKPEAGFGTLAVHAGQAPDPTTGAIMPPIYQTSTYVQEGLGRPRAGYEYARVQNPTREALEGNVAALEGGRHGTAFASGLAATEAIVKHLA